MPWFLVVCRRLREIWAVAFVVRLYPHELVIFTPRLCILRPSKALSFVLSVLGLGHFELPLPLQNLGRVSSPLLVMGLGRLDFSVPVLDFVHMGSSLPARSFA